MPYSRLARCRSDTSAAWRDGLSRHAAARAQAAHPLAQGHQERVLLLRQSMGGLAAGQLSSGNPGVQYSA